MAAGETVNLTSERKDEGMSKYEELKEKLEDTDDYLENCQCDYCVHARKDVQAFECAAASLIERAREQVKRTAYLCCENKRSLGIMNCNECGFCDTCETVALLAEMEALT